MYQIQYPRYARGLDEAFRIAANYAQQDKKGDLWYLRLGDGSKVSAEYNGFVWTEEQIDNFVQVGKWCYLPEQPELYEPPK